MTIRCGFASHLHGTPATCVSHSHGADGIRVEVSPCEPARTIIPEHLRFLPNFVLLKCGWLGEYRILMHRSESVLMIKRHQVKSPQLVAYSRRPQERH